MSEKIKVIIEGEERDVAIDTDLLELSKDYAESHIGDIVLAKVDDKLVELSYKITKECKISFIGTDTVCGNDTYRRSTLHLMLKAFYDVCGFNNIEKITVEYSLGKGYYCEMKGNLKVKQELLFEIKKHMDQLVLNDIPIVKSTISTDEAIERFKKHKMYDKVKLFKYRRGSTVNVYSLKGFEDYYYGYMVPSTGYLKYFELFPYDEGFVLQLPIKEEPKKVPTFEPQHKVFQILKEANAWSELLEIDTVGAFNEQISQGNINDLILVQEALQEKKIADIAETITKKDGIKFIMVAGPSSSGKTTFARRLSIQLRAHGMKPHLVEVDNYFVDRENSPKDQYGNNNYEVLEALDVEGFNKDMTDLLEGREVQMPQYNFKTGKREYKGDFKKLGSDDVLIIEGIHCLNDKLSYSLPKESKYKVYISALTQLNIDEHNRIPTTDGRLLRRMVRDSRYRATTAEETIARWNSVRIGEDNYIFPFQEEADIMFNSALIYELGVIKQFAEPLLFNVPKSSPHYQEAKRLLKFLSYFLTVNSEIVPGNSLLREFIGGSIFYS
jgi:uridine kinase